MTLQIVTNKEIETNCSTVFSIGTRAQRKPSPSLWFHFKPSPSLWFHFVFGKINSVKTHLVIHKGKRITSAAQLMKTDKGRSLLYLMASSKHYKCQFEPSIHSKPNPNAKVEPTGGSCPAELV